MSSTILLHASTFSSANSHSPSLLLCTLCAPPPLFSSITFLSIHRITTGPCNKRGISSLRKRTLRLQPGRKGLQFGIHLPQRLDVGVVADVAEPAEHQPKVLDHPQQEEHEERVRRRQVGAGLVLEDGPELRVRQVVAGQRERFARPLGAVDECLRGEEANVRRRHQLQRFALQHRVVGGREHLAVEVGRQVLHERHGSQDRPRHLVGVVARHREQVLLDVVLGCEMGDLRRGVVVAAPVDRGVDEVLDVVGDRGVDQGFALSLFGALAVADTGLWNLSVNVSSLLVACCASLT